MRARKIKSALVLLRLLLDYCLRGGGLRTTAAWASASDLADVSNVAVLYRLRACDAWLERLVASALAQRTALPVACGSAPPARRRSDEPI